MEQEKAKGIYLYSMEYALYFGLILIIKMVLSSFARELSFVAILVSLFVVIVPFAGYVLTKRFRDVSGYVKFSQIFLFGIFMYFFASLLSGIFDYVYYQYINPEFFQEQITEVNAMVQELLTASGSDKEMKAALEQELPSTPIEMVYNSIFGMLLMGAVYALVVALFLSKKQIQK